MEYLVGIDIGGTKYQIRAETPEGKKVDITVPSKGNLTGIGEKKMALELSALVREVKKRLRTRHEPQAVCIGLSGLDSPTQHRRMLSELMKQSWWRKISAGNRMLVNDVLIGLRAGTQKRPAMAIIAGTGSNGYGIGKGGKEYSVSGRGIFMSDEGGGAQMGIDALKAVRQAEDGRGPSTTLKAAVFKHFRAKDTAQIATKVYDPSFTKRDLAGLNFIVEEQAAKGDRVAKAILQKAADDLLSIADALKKRMGVGRQKVDVVLIGGTINRNHVVRNMFLKGARKRSWMHPIPLVDDPVAGAIELARERLDA